MNLPAVVAHAFKPRTQKAKVDLSEFKATLFYIVSSMSGKAT